MRDSKVSYPRIELLHPAIRSEVLNCINEAEVLLPADTAIRIVQGLRTIDEQNELYAQGRTKPGKIVTNARGGSSFHSYGLAIDFTLLYDKDHNGTFETISWDATKDGDCDGHPDWMEVVEVFEKAGYQWGGRWHTIIDKPHFQKSYGYTWKELLIKYNNKEFIEGTKYVKL